MWVVGEGLWQGPVPLTPRSFTQPSTSIGVAHQTSMNQLDIFVADANGTMNVLWVSGEGKWQRPAPLPGPFVV
jgi:hypothetical protein